jgi:hypothetical protein
MMPIMMDIEKTNGSSKYDIVKCKQTSARLLKRAANNRPNNSNGRSKNNEKTTTTAEAVASHHINTYLPSDGTLLVGIA